MASEKPMMTFQEWMVERHPEAIEEGFMKNVALAGALAAGAAGAAGWTGGGKAAHPDRPGAASRDMESDPTFQRDTRIFGRGRATERYHQRSGRENMADQLKAAGKSSGTFEQGKLKTDYTKSSATSDDANEFLR